MLDFVCRGVCNELDEINLKSCPIKSDKKEHLRVQKAISA